MKYHVNGESVSEFEEEVCNSSCNENIVEIERLRSMSPSRPWSRSSLHSESVCDDDKTDEQDNTEIIEISENWPESDEEDGDRPKKRKRNDKFGNVIINDAEIDDDLKDDWNVDVEGMDLSAIDNEIVNQSLLPGIEHPKLWAVTCKSGQENDTALLLMKKFLKQSTDEPYQIKSVVVPKGIKGYVYIEAFKKEHVETAIENVANLSHVKLAPRQIPISEMVDVLKVNKSLTKLQPKQWVRIKQGLYKDDIAQIDQIIESKNKVLVKLIPRIDYTKLRGPQKIDNDPLKRKRSKKSPAMLFDPKAIRNIGGEVTTNGDFCIFERQKYKQGFLFKTFKLTSIDAEGIRPTLLEAETFDEALESDDIDNIRTTNTDIFGNLKAGNHLHTFNEGDNVLVIEGDLKDLYGTVVAVKGDIVSVLPKHKLLQTNLEFHACQLKMIFQIGDHVKVVAGRYEGSTGLIVKVEDDRVLLLTDMSYQEKRVLTKNIRMCTNMTVGVETVRNLVWGDLVNISNNTVGVIIQLQRETFHVLNMYGKVTQTRPDGLTKRPIYPEPVDLDCQQNSIRKKDTVKVVDGPYAGKSGTIRHLYRSYAFLHSTTCMENGGIFVCRTRHVLLPGCTGKGSSDIESNGSISSKILASPRHPTGGNCNTFVGAHTITHRGRGNRGGRGGGRNENRKFIGVTVKIIKGPYKGKIGIIKNVGDLTVQIELHTMCRTITVCKENVAICNDSGKAFDSSSPFLSGDRTLMSNKDVSGSPIYTSGFQTPIYSGSLTPLHDEHRSPSQTGAWDPHIPNTPVYSNDGGTVDFEICKNAIDNTNRQYHTPITKIGRELNFNLNSQEKENWDLE